MNWFSRLPTELQKSAYVYDGEAAWAREDALNVIQALSDIGKTVLGVEVWLRTDGAPRIPSPYIYQWDSDQMDPSDPKPSALAINAAGCDYVKSLDWDAHDIGVLEEQPYFNLTVS